MTYYTYHFRWPNTDGGVENVQITGNFDDWKRSTGGFVKEDGGFEGDIRLNEKQDLVFKFIINDTEWKVSGDYKIQLDSSGIENNVVNADELVEIEEFEQDENFQAEADATNEDVELKESSHSIPGKVAGEDDKDLTQVLTSTSSFAAVSFSESGISHIDADDLTSSKEGEVVPDVEDDTDELFNTPTNSVANSTVITGSSAKPRKDQTSSPEKIKKNDSNITLTKDHSIEVIKVPGAYPKSSETSYDATASSSEVRGSGRKDSLISRFKSLFKY